MMAARSSGTGHFVNTWVVSPQLKHIDRTRASSAAIASAASAASRVGSLCRSGQRRHGKHLLHKVVEWHCTELNKLHRIE